ncbi:MAG: mechanosensitive ion channel family protein, partial [Pseudomonadota bacterium]
MEQITLYLERIAALFGPNPYLQAAVIAVVSILIAKIGEIACTRVIGRLTSRSATKIDDAVLELIRRPTFLTLVVIGLIVATGRLPVATTVIDGTRSALLTILLVVWMGALIRAVRLLIGSATLGGKAVFEPRMQPLFQNVAQLLIIAFSLYAFFNIWQLDISAWVASAGIVGLALSFAARDTLANLFAGASIIADAPYKVGDFIIIDSGE